MLVEAVEEEGNGMEWENEREQEEEEHGEEEEEEEDLMGGREGRDWRGEVSAFSLARCGE